MKTIVLVDHNKDHLQFMKEALSSIDTDIQCLSFVFPEEARKAMMTNVVQKPNLIVINLNMRGKNAIHWLTDLRSDAKFDDVPVVLYASKITPDIVRELGYLGPTLTFEKPNTLRGWKIAMQDMLISIPNIEIDVEALFINTKNSVYFD